MLPFKRDYISKLLKEQHLPAIEKAKFMETEFDNLFVKYIQTIHINEAVNMNDNLLIGKLWLNLYFLFSDAEDEIMKKYCAEQALPRLKTAYDEETLDDYSKQCIAFTIANLSALFGTLEDAKKFYGIALVGKDSDIKSHALRMREHLQK